MDVGRKRLQRGARNAFDSVLTQMQTAQFLQNVLFHLETTRVRICRSPIDHGSGMITEVRPEKSPKILDLLR